MISIRRQLLIWQISALVVTGLLVSVITYALAWHAFNRLRDDNLAQIAYSILRHGVESDSGNDAGDDDDKGQFVSQIWDDKHALVYSSIDDGPPAQPSGNRVVDWHGEEWHVFTLRSGGLTIQVSNPSYHRTALFVRITAWLLLPLIVLVAVLGSLIWTAVGRALRPLRRVRYEIGRRDFATLHALDTRRLPEEIVPLVDALNALLIRLDGAISTQRRFVADAAHELRTPLTAIRLQAQLASQSTEPEARSQALAELQQGVDRAARLVDQLLSMARVEAVEQKPRFAAIRLDELVKRVVADFSTQADAKEIDLGVTECAAAQVNGHADSLRMMVGNLIDNALRYTPSGGRVDVALVAGDGKAVLSVVDTGPGIPAGERERVFDRFHRLAGAEIPGSGLGLAIVRQAAELHGGRVSLDAAVAGGLAARIELPAA
ncbi:ATP-binding protein [Parasulfuritortus cantonensis]|uniref:ATP-binding protein n=1 Tax=Parasulfuritortus cantonensis TaxID=2528202 RepID=UPI001404DA6A|nr:ATP-binding protein [Parasulfuritortus cantonensis]